MRVNRIKKKAERQRTSIVDGDYFLLKKPLEPDEYELNGIR
jgi:hypothetical protein